MLSLDYSIFNTQRCLISFRCKTLLNINIYGKGFALLKKTWQGSYNLLRFQDLEFIETLGEISLVGGEREG